MRALQVTRAIGADGVRIVDVPNIDSPDGVLIDVRDRRRKFPRPAAQPGLYQERAVLPYTLGGEAAGVGSMHPTGLRIATPRSSGEEQRRRGRRSDDPGQVAAGRATAFHRLKVSIPADQPPIILIRRVVKILPMYLGGRCRRMPLHDDPQRGSKDTSHG
jgi:hypothetical protein